MGQTPRLARMKQIDHITPWVKVFRIISEIRILRLTLRAVLD